MTSVLLARICSVITDCIVDNTAITGVLNYTVGTPGEIPLVTTTTLALADIFFTSPQAEFCIVSLEPMI